MTFRGIGLVRCSYCWWFRNPIPNHLGCFWHPVNNGINYQPQLVIAGFLGLNQLLTWTEKRDITVYPPPQKCGRVCPQYAHVDSGFLGWFLESNAKCLKANPFRFSIFRGFWHGVWEFAIHLKGTDLLGPFFEEILGNKPYRSWSKNIMLSYQLNQLAND